MKLMFPIFFCFTVCIRLGFYLVTCVFKFLKLSIFDREAKIRMETREKPRLCTVKRPTLGGIRLGSGRIYSQVDFEVWFQLSVGFSSANGGRLCGLE